MFSYNVWWGWRTPDKRPETIPSSRSFRFTAQCRCFYLSVSSCSPLVPYQSVMFDITSVWSRMGWDLAREPYHLRVFTKQANDSWRACFAMRTPPRSVGIKGLVLLTLEGDWAIGRDPISQSHWLLRLRSLLQGTSYVTETFTSLIFYRIQVRGLDWP